MVNFTVPDWEGKTLDAILREVPADRCLRIEVVRIWQPANRAGLMLSHVDPGAPRRVAARLCPLLIGDEGETAADLLEKLARALRLAQGHTLCDNICTAGQVADQNVFFHCARPAGHEGMHEMQGAHWR